MGFTSGFLREDSLSRTADGYRVLLHLPWMRSLPLSSIADLSLAFDEVPVAADDLRFEVDGEALTLSDLAARWRRFWPPQERMAVEVPFPSAVAPGETVRVAATIDLLLPYILTPVGPPRIPAAAERDLVVRGG